MSKTRGLKNSDIYALRRQALLNKLQPDDIVIMPAAAEHYRVPGIEYPYRQDSNVLYLTDYIEPDSVVILAPNRKEGEFVIFNLPRDPSKEVWTGKRVGQEAAVTTYHADQAFIIDTLEQHMPELLAGRNRVFFPFYPINGELNEKHYEVFREQYFLDTFRSAGVETNNILPLISEMRLFKQPDEITAMREAIRMTGLGHLAAMKACQPGMMEYELEAKLNDSFYANGSRFPAYPNIVASGENACTLHYEENTKTMHAGELVLIDAGAEYLGYAADITRTFPVSGKFSPEQKAIYDIVLRAQKVGIAAVKPQATWNDIREAVAKEVIKGLVELGILQGNIDELYEAEAHTKYYMHSPGHWIGLDVHDVGRKDFNGKIGARPFEPGMVLTMEPGIYISDKHDDIPEKWHNIGVRIEDMLLVTETGHENLSRAIPKERHDIERLMLTAAYQNGLPTHGMFAQQATINDNSIETEKTDRLRQSCYF